MPPPQRPPGGRPGPGGNGPTGRPTPLRPPPPGPPGRQPPAAPGRLAPAGRPTTAGRPAPAQAQRAAEEELERRFDRLDRSIQKLQVEFNRFFAGDLQHPPLALRDEIETEMRRLRSMNMRRSVDGFRFGSLEARLNSYTEMFSRRLRNQEEGKVAPRHPSRPAARKHDVDAGVVVGPQCEHDAVEALFQGLAERNPRGATMDLDTFRGYLQKQVAQIRDKTGCEAVQFRVVNEEGKV
jgi:hypothetical protein